MAEGILIEEGLSKNGKYASLLPQLEALIEGESDFIANLGNIAAGLKSAFGWHWVGFYLAKKGELVLGPFQGPVACTRIQLGKGVCGKAYSDKQTIIVADVDQFPGHISCSSLSKSEIVVPLLDKGEVKLVLDVDSSELNDFDKTDQEGLEMLIAIICRKCFTK